MNQAHSKCTKCCSSLEKIQGGMLFCRACKLPHDSDGVALFDGPSLASHFNPLAGSRATTQQHHKGFSAVAKTALEMTLIQNMHDAYLAGLKDGILLAYSQDYTEGEPMEKVGVSNENLKAELQEKYNELKVRQSSSQLTKEASAQISSEMEAIKEKINELDSE